MQVRAGHTRVSHAEKCVQVRVHAECVVMDTQQRYTTNTFHFTFATRDDDAVNRVMPKTYAGECMCVLASNVYTRRWHVISKWQATL
jgi:hypothetical protein